MASAIKRTGEFGGLLHEVVEHGDMIYFAGLVSEDLKLDMAGQTKDVLNQLEKEKGIQRMDIAGELPTISSSSMRFVSEAAGLREDDTACRTTDTAFSRSIGFVR